jgi:hypothetical protein
VVNLNGSGLCAFTSSLARVMSALRLEPRGVDLPGSDGVSNDDDRDS